MKTHMYEFLTMILRGQANAFKRKIHLGIPCCRE